MRGGGNTYWALLRCDYYPLVFTYPKGTEPRFPPPHCIHPWIEVVLTWFTESRNVINLMGLGQFIPQQLAVLSQILDILDPTQVFKGLYPRF